VGVGSRKLWKDPSRTFYIRLRNPGSQAVLSSCVALLERNNCRLQHFATDWSTNTIHLTKMLIFNWFISRWSRRFGRRSRQKDDCEYWQIYAIASKKRQGHREESDTDITTTHTHHRAEHIQHTATNTNR